MGMNGSNSIKSALYPANGRYRIVLHAKSAKYSQSLREDDGYESRGTSGEVVDNVSHNALTLLRGMIQIDSLDYSISSLLSSSLPASPLYTVHSTPHSVFAPLIIITSFIFISSDYRILPRFLLELPTSPPTKPLFSTLFFTVNSCVRTEGIPLPPISCCFGGPWRP